MKKLILSFYSLVFLGSIPFIAYAEKRPTVDEIAGYLIAPCCYRQTVQVHYSGVAEQMKEEIRQMIEEGKTKDQIIGFYVEKYGEKILAMPSRKGFDILAYLMTPVFMALSLAVILIYLKNRLGAAKMARGIITSSPMKSRDGKINQRLEKELRDLDF